jgi:Flp pilus assembly protein TadG
LRDLLKDKRGVGAVEFALIAPILLSLYITSFEITVGLSVSKRVTRSASTIADLLTRESSVSKATLATMTAVADSILFPFAPTTKVIKVTGVKLDATGAPKVEWSWSSAGGAPYAVGTPVDVPNDMRLPDTFLIRAEVAVNHKLLMFLTGPSGTGYQDITMRREFFYRQRTGSSIPCSDCS